MSSHFSMQKYHHIAFSPFCYQLPFHWNLMFIFAFPDALVFFVLCSNLMQLVDTASQFATPQFLASLFSVIIVFHPVIACFVTISEVLMVIFSLFTKLA